LGGMSESATETRSGSPDGGKVKNPRGAGTEGFFTEKSAATEFAVR
jgi:hypothetical protein